MISCKFILLFFRFANCSIGCESSSWPAKAVSDIKMFEINKTKTTHQHVLHDQIPMKDPHGVQVLDGVKQLLDQAADVMLRVDIGRVKVKQIHEITALQRLTSRLTRLSRIEIHQQG